MRENLGVYGCNNLSYNGTFSVVLTARGFFTRFGFSTYILCCDCFILSHLFFCLLMLLFAMSYGRILGTAFPRSSVVEDYPQQLVSEPYGFGNECDKSLREIVWRTWWHWGNNDHGCLVWFSKGDTS